MKNPPKPADLDALSDEDRTLFVGHVLILLRSSPFKQRSSWRHALVIFSDREKRVTTRTDHAAWLRANALDAPAVECTARQCPPGHVLIWLEADNAKGACASFALLDLAAEVKRVRATHDFG